MKKVALLLVLVLAVAIPTMIHADDPPPPLVITPYVDGAIYYPEPNQEVIIRARWGTCSRGLARAFTRAASISLEIAEDLGPFEVTVDPPATEYWTRRPQIMPNPPVDPSVYCIINSDDIWMVEWSYSELGVLSTGTYTGDFFWSTIRPVHDGGEGVVDPADYDGKIDGWEAGYVFKDTNFTIIAP